MTTIPTILIVLASLACALTGTVIGLIIVSVVILHKLEKFAKRHSNLLRGIGTVTEFIGIAGSLFKSIK